MPPSRKTNPELAEENRRLRAQIAQLEDKLDHLSEHGVAAKALHHNEALHRDVMSAVSEVVLIADDAGRLSYVSPNAHLIFGHTAADILKQSRINFVLPRELFDPDVLEQRGEISNIDCEIRDSVGRKRNLLLTVRKLNEFHGNVMYVCRDITERIKMEQEYELLSITLEKQVDFQTIELRESRDRYRRLVEGLRDEYLFYATEIDGTITYISPSVHTILGHMPGELIGRNWREFVNQADPSFEEIERLEQLRYAGIDTPVFCVPIPRSNGDVRILEFRDIPLRDRNGTVIANEGIGKDITRQHAAEEALRKARAELEQRVEERTAELKAKNEQLRQSQERYLSVIQDHLEFIVRWREDGTRTFVNDSYCAHCGANSDSLVDTSFTSSIIEDDRAELQKKLDSLSVERPVVVFEHRTITSDGRMIWEHWTHRALFDPQGKLIEFQSVGCDVTERRKREEHARERAQAVEKLHALTDREHAVLQLVVDGDANKVIARKLGLSIKTIEKHRSSVMKKLHVRSVPELVRLALFVECNKEG